VLHFVRYLIITINYSNNYNEYYVLVSWNEMLSHLNCAHALSWWCDIWQKKRLHRELIFTKLSIQSCYWMSLQHHIFSSYLEQFQHCSHAKCWCGSNISSVQCDILKIFITDLLEVYSLHHCNLFTNMEINKQAKQTNSMVWVLERTILTEWPPLVGEVSANFCG
jgi:hypothetical protein